MDCNPDDNIGDSLNDNLKNYVKRISDIELGKVDWLKKKYIYICVYYRIGKEEKMKYFKLKNAWPFSKYE